MRSGQSMWILTKMAMLFFIAALALILVLFGGIVKGGLCQSSAQSTNARIANAINQVLNSPLEDERRVIPIENSLAIGDSKSSRYSIAMAKRMPDPNPTVKSGFLILTTTSELDPSCTSGLQVAYPKTYEYSGGASPVARERLYLVSERTESGASLAGAFKSRITLLPSLSPDKETTAPPSHRSKFIVVMGCTNKTITREKYFFIQDCWHDDSNDCLNFKLNTTEAGIPDSSVGDNYVPSICSFS